jgi:hypothetical protein
MSDFPLLLSDLQSVIEPQTPQSELSKVFIRFQTEISLSSFSIYPSAEDLISPFRIVWQIFLEACHHPNTTVRLSARRSIGWFLLKLTPFHPEQMISAFLQSIRHSEPDPFTSPFIIASYLFLSRIIAPPFVSLYFTFEVIAPHFLIDDTTFSEDTATSIDSFVHFGIDWLHDLLHHFLTKLPRSPSRHLIHALASIISYRPSDFLKDTIETIDSNCLSYLSIFASLLTSVKCDFSILDLRAIIDRALTVVGDEHSATTDIDSGLEVLSVISGVKVVLEGSIFVISVAGIETIARVGKAQMIGRSSFYLLPLSIDLLKPRETDRGLLLISKFTQLARFVNNDVNRFEIRAIFYESLQKPWGDELSAALRGLSLCVNLLDINLGLLRELLAAPNQSWAHSRSLLSILKEINIEFITECFCIEIIELLINFCVHKSAELSKEARMVIPKFARAYDIERVCQILMKRIQIYEVYELPTLVNILIELETQFPQ